MQTFGIRQAWALVLFCSAVLVAIPIITYKTMDPGWLSVVYPQPEVRNFFGHGGAWFADLCYSLFGYFAFFLPVVFLCAGVAQMRGKANYMRWKLPLAFVLAWCGGTLLSSLHFPNFIPLPVSTGGILGVQLASLVVPHAPLEVITLVALFVFLWGFSLLLGFSWVRVAERCGGVFVYLYQLLFLIKKFIFGPERVAVSGVPYEGETFPSEAAPQHTSQPKNLWKRFSFDTISATKLFSSKRSHRRRMEPSLGDIEGVEQPTEVQNNLKEGLYADSRQVHSSQLTAIAQMRRAYEEHIGEVSPELQTTIGKIQNHAQLVEGITIEEPITEATEATEATEPHSQTEVPEITTEPHSQTEVPEITTEPQSQTEVPEIAAQQPVQQQHPETAQGDEQQPPHKARVVFDSSEGSINFADVEDDEDWDDFDYQDEIPANHIDTEATHTTPATNNATPPSTAEAIEPAEPAEEIDFALAEQEQATTVAQQIPTLEASATQQPTTSLLQQVRPKTVVYSLPSVDQLAPSQEQDRVEHDAEWLQEMGTQLEQNLLDFGIKAEVEEIHPGPVVTRFEITPAPGVKVVRITNLVKDIARSMSVTAVRIVEVIPGKSTIGIEIPNAKRAMVRLSQVIGSSVYRESKSKLPLALGYDIQGKSVVVPLEKMPHLLVAGTTGSGKSVGVNAMLLSLLYHLNPEQLRLLLIDPKMLELSVYNGIPHLLAPVITDMKDAANGLTWCVAEMERRYKLMSKMGVRNLDGYNAKIKSAEQPIRDPMQTDPNGTKTLATLPHIVLIIDEFADMMMIVGKKVEELIARIAQKARAAGIHMILATQRPSVDVITGLIKANVPTRIAFQVSSKIDSRTILDQAGADQLLGHGDMLFLPPGQGVPQRVHGAFVSDEEVHKIVNYWKAQDAPEYMQEITKDPEERNTEDGEGQGEEESDELFNEAVNFIHETQRVSISMLQRKFKIGYNRAARIIDDMEEQGIVSAMESNGKREIL